MKEIFDFLQANAQPVEPDNKWYIKGGYCNGLSIEFNGDHFVAIESSEYSSDCEVTEFSTLAELEAIINIF